MKQAIIEQARCDMNTGRDGKCSDPRPFSMNTEATEVLSDVNKFSQEATISQEDSKHSTIDSLSCG